MHKSSKPKSNQSLSKWIIVFLVVFFGVGVIGLAYDATRDFFIHLIPYSLLLGVILMFWVHQYWTLKQIIVFAIIAVLGFSIEVVGVLTGDVFGNYTYGGALGVLFWGTPPMIGLNWLMLIYCVFVIMKQTAWPQWLQVLLGAFLMVVYDIIMEPVAIQLDMWSWGGNVIPLQNYIAWFVISLVFLAIFSLSKLNFTNRVAPALFFIQMGFFLLLNIFI